MPWHTEIKETIIHWKIHVLYEVEGLVPRVAAGFHANYGKIVITVSMGQNP
jgi:hypothetical protein